MIKKALITISSLFITLTWLAYMLSYIALYIPIYLSILSVLTFLMYAWDKRKAIQSVHKKVNRTPERTLQLLALCGGWPGALFAQQLLRHKSKKRRFIFVLWACIAVNLGGFVYFWLNRGSLLV
ncbi:DUF1294 domain-containing protein [Pseudoalteromonas sp. 20-92]|uniref:DUF1294 domain-containing protein n=1 Tax=Pseudoalteromonas sp. 20-92 TaxID=2969394 RepID=UPI0027B3BDE5|nr:DUF1294 domain-containing protein [Pseudoalteromonas sp. 20-92]MDQ2044880.1 DUF1294 domain-containing protein [Pseudoalteromonas sp. 20-92]